MRILLPTVGLPPYQSGGGPVTAKINAEALLAQGHDVRVVYAADHDELDNVGGLEVKRIKSPNIYWNYRDPHPPWQKMIWHGLENYNPWAEKALRREIKEFQPDLVFTISIENVNVATWRAAKSLNVPSVHQACSTYLLCWKASMIRDNKPCSGQCTDCKITSLGKKALSQLPQGLIGESDFIIRAHIERGYFTNAMTLRQPGAMVPVTGGKPNRRTKNAPLRVGFLGELSHLKAPDLLAKTSHMMGDRDIRFVIGGKSNDGYGADLEKQFAPDSATLLGWTDPTEFFQSIDVLVLPSRGSEVFGRVMVEAYAHGLPVIGSDMGGIPESIIHGETGFIFSSGNVDALSAQINQLHDDTGLYNAMAIKAFEKSGDYHPDLFGKNLTDFFESIINNYHSDR